MVVQHQTIVNPLKKITASLKSRITKINWNTHEFLFIYNVLTPFAIFISNVFLPSPYILCEQSSTLFWLPVFFDTFFSHEQCALSIQLSFGEFFNECHVHLQILPTLETKIKSLYSYHFWWCEIYYQKCSNSSCTWALFTYFMWSSLTVTHL